MKMGSMSRMQLHGLTVWEIVSLTVVFILMIPNLLPIILCSVNNHFRHCLCHILMVIQRNSYKFLTEVIGFYIFIVGNQLWTGDFVT